MPHDSEFSDALAAALFAFDAGHRSTAAVTAAITRLIVRWAHAHSWAARTEVRVELGDPFGSMPLLGFVDVLINRGERLPPVAIEIDSADKPWSVSKLQHLATAGMHAVWVRWGDDAWAGVYDGVDVIQLRELRRTLHRSADEQMTAW